jgi:hypothetical protein
VTSVAALPTSQQSVVPYVPWAEHHRAMVDNWTIEDTPHVSMIAPTGSGKTILMTRGLMPALTDEQVLYFDVKGWDENINRLHMRRVRRFPTKFERNMRDTEPQAKWYVYRANDSVDTGQMMERAYAEGGWTMILDEERAMTDRHPNLGLMPLIEKYRMRGRGRVSVISATQAPRFVASSFYEQASHLYIARVEDKRARRRLQEIGGDTDKIDQVVSQLARHEFLYIGPLGAQGSRIMEVTKVDV